MTRTTLDVVIPAWNEEDMIGDCIAALISQELPEPVRVVVVANGCSDRTAEIARSYCRRAAERDVDLLVVECTERGKPAALNAGEQRCSPGSHRLYLDADTRLAPGAITALLTAFDRGFKFAAPALRLDYSDAPWVCRSYWRCWAALPNVRGAVVGAGAYAVSAHGRSRWSRFPKVIADDLYVRSRFSRDETVVVESVSFTTAAPTSVTGTIRMLTRWRYGNVQLRMPAAHRGDDARDSVVESPLQKASLRSTVAAVLPYASAWDLIFFAFITLVVRTRMMLGRPVGAWERGR